MRSPSSRDRLHLNLCGKGSHRVFCWRGRKAETVILRQLNRCVGEISPALQSQIQSLTLDRDRLL
ncbi:DUF4351 domain-containing protein [Altericista sp. CCNU0014]|uniref:DUF4351 domain-containing protein n=1 Tax=Altericista sp. CCNU0014 TaxID=3082949 RepID=UPI00384AEE10